MINQNPVLTHEEIQFAHNLRAVREHLCLSRPKFAALLDMPPTTLKNYELKYRSAPAALIFKLNACEQTRQFVPELLQCKPIGLKVAA